MSLLYYLNYGILAAFLSLFFVEVGMAIYALVSYGRYRERIWRYIMPLWEITGTFAVFYGASLIATYPNLIPVIAPIYIGPIVAVALIFILRNAFLGYSEIMGRHDWDRALFTIYSLSTLTAAFVTSAILCSAVSGIGLNTSAGTVNIVMMLFNWFNVSVFASLVLMGFAGATVLVSERIGRRAATRHIRKVIIPLIFLSVLIFAGVQDQSLFGGVSSLSKYVTNDAASHYLIIATLGGGAFVATGLVCFVYITYLKKAVE